MQKETENRRRIDPMVVAVNALGITQITAWGTSFYCLGVLAKPIVAETGWAMTTVFLGFSVALIIMGLISTAVGRLIDRIGARVVMSIGATILSAGLLALSQVRDQVSYLMVWAIIGVGMRCCLYDAAFAALVQVVPTRGRKAISYLTLYGAYASTVFWVIGHYLNNAYGWRSTLAIFAAINLAICLPLNWFGLSRHEDVDEAAPAATAAASPDGPALEGRMRVVGIALFALIMSINGFVFGVISLQLVPLLEAAGLVGARASAAPVRARGDGNLMECLLGAAAHAAGCRLTPAVS
jgi:MFS family permease